MDITNDMVYKETVGEKNWLKLMDKHELIDIWREMNEGIRLLKTTVGKRSN